MLVKKTNIHTMSECPVESLIQLLSKKYMINIIKDLYNGKTHFNEFLESNPKLTNKSLSRCLKYMDDNGLVEKVINSDNTQYFLTDKSRKMDKIFYELINYTINDNTVNLEDKKILIDEIEKIFNND